MAHANGTNVPAKKIESTTIEVSVETRLMESIDRLVAENIFDNREDAVNQAVRELIKRLDKKRLEIERTQSDPQYKETVTREFISGDDDDWTPF